ncbi:MAG: isoleucine--tRNA ligase [Sphaerochaetaceae bacterium]|nr:isoleucine--tRNA ligase [Sphaerochaetaceae bacterium]
MFKAVSNSSSFSSAEKEILKFWSDNSIFSRSVEERSVEREFVFYDGPPFATGLPHYGHFVPGTIKDVIPRYKTMKGYRVERRFGWDCHGLPVENEMKKLLGISSHKEIEEFGIANYNEECRKIVLRYTSEWREQINRMGRWVDFDRDYKTMDTKYMESIWWVFKTLYDKGLIYEGYNILPYSPALGAPLSNFELNVGGYKDVNDPAITVRFKVDGEDRTYFLAWTTTPWTLPSNLALCVGKNIPYVKLRDKSSGDYYYIAQSRIGAYFKTEDEYEIVAHLTGDDLKGKTYEPLFDYFASLKNKGAFVVVTGDHVTDSDGCGIVHTAPGFGEDDYKVLKGTGIPTVCPIDDTCSFTDEVADYKGRFVKDCDKDIIARLKSEGKLVKRETILHAYPFCYRTGCPIIYRALTCWFVDVPKIRDILLASNEEVTWIPSHLKHGRFGKWLEGAREWAISRNRFWGNPIPVWKSESGKYIEVIGSIKELEEKSGQKVTDLHKHYVDSLTWKAPDGTLMKRVDDVLDCWFESGSMPYAQVHYPFENKDRFEKNFPADFICEGLDQTRGWFYSLAVIAAGLFSRPAFLNCVTNGIVLNAEGKKMSKSLRNFTPPMEVIEKFGADALRFALMNSAVVRAEDLKFSEEFVSETIKSFLLPIRNAYSFFVLYANIDKWGDDRSDKETPHDLTNELDIWLVSITEKLIKDVTDALESYHIDEAASYLVKFIDSLNNWYIRRSRRRFWKSENDRDKTDAYRVLYWTLMTFIKLACPFVPFITEEIYQNLKSDNSPDSIHLTSYPEYNESERNYKIEREMALSEMAVILGRRVRSLCIIKNRQPLNKAYIFTRNADDLNTLKRMDSLIKEELNVHDIEYSDNENSLVTYTAKANFKTLGKIYGSSMKNVAKQIEKWDSSIISTILNGSSVNITINDISYDITKDDIIVTSTAKEGVSLISEGGISVALDIVITPELKKEGYVRSLVREIQEERKKSALDVSDYISLTLSPSSGVLLLDKDDIAYIQKETLASSYHVGENNGSVRDVEDEKVCIKVQKA